MNQRLRSQINRVQWVALLIGVSALTACIVGAFGNRRQFFISYLFGCLFWLGLTLGCFSVTMIHHLTGGRWGYPVRRFLEAGFGVLPLMLALFIPVFFGLHDLYPWAHPAGPGQETTFPQKQGYLNAGGFIVRAVVFFAIWIVMAGRLRKWSLEQDHTSDAAPTRKLRTLSGPGLVLFALSATFAYVDWIMSTEKQWYSTMFAVIVLIGQILIACSFAVVLLALFKRQEPLSGVVTTTHCHHLGNLMFTFVLFWTYVSFGQLLVIYSGNLPHEIDWYLHRIAGQWIYVVGALALFHFFLPFFLLLFRTIKCHAGPLTAIAAVLFLAHIVQIYWLVMPSFHQHGIRGHWLDAAALLGLGGVWTAAFLGRLKAAPLLPQHDPGHQFSLPYAHAS